MVNSVPPFAPPVNQTQQRQQQEQQQHLPQQEDLQYPHQHEQQQPLQHPRSHLGGIDTRKAFSSEQTSRDFSTSYLAAVDNLMLFPHRLDTTGMFANDVFPGGDVGLMQSLGSQLNSSSPSLTSPIIPPSNCYRCSIGHNNSKDDVAVPRPPVHREPKAEVSFTHYCWSKCELRLT